MRLARSPNARRIDNMPPDANARRLPVLVVDDNPEVGDALALVLRLYGHDARVAYGGEQAMAITTEWTTDVALLVIVMNGVGGIELAARLRKGATWPVLIVALIGVGTNNDEVARVKAGAFDYFLPKPVDLDERLRLLDERAFRRIS